MATHFDLEEQEQLDQLKAFWKNYGQLVTWLVIGMLAAYAAWNGWHWWQRDQSIKAAAMFDQLDKAARSGDADQTGRIFADMRSRYPGTAFTEQAGLIAAKTQFDKGQTDAALASLAWVEANAIETEYRTIARLRAAGVLLDQKKYDDALKRLDAPLPPDAPVAFAALVADRRGDILQAQGKVDEAKAAYQKAWQSMDAKVEYRRLTEAKLIALGVMPTAASAPASGAAR